MTKLATAAIAFIMTAAETMVGADAAENSGRYAELAGVKLWLTDTGGTGAPLVLLHSNTGTSAVWQSQVDVFSRAGYRVIAFDRRGWGKSIAVPATGPQPGTIAGDLDAHDFSVMPNPELPEAEGANGVFATLAPHRAYQVPVAPPGVGVASPLRV